MPANPFVIERGQAPMQGIAMLAPAMARRGERALERSKQKQYMKLREDTARIMNTGTPEEVADHVAKNPGAKNIIDETLSFKSSMMVDAAKRALIGGEDTTDMWLEMADTVDREGGNATTYINAAKEEMQNPGSSEDDFLKILAMYDKPSFDNVMKMRGVGDTQRDTRTAAIKDYEYGLKNPGFAAAQKKQAEDNKLTEHELKLASMLASGEIDASQIPKRGKTYNRIVSGAKEINPELNIRSATADYNLSKNPTFRQRTLTAEVLPDIIQHVVDAGKKVDFSNIKAVGGFQKFYKQNINDPDFVEYMALRNDALMELASVMRGGGMTDKAHHAEEEAMSPTMSPRALDAWMRAQEKALKPRLAIQRRIIEGGTKKTGRKKRRKYNPQTGGFE